MLDLSAIARNRLNSFFVWPVEPSAMFSATESLARLICGANTKRSSYGKFWVTLATWVERAMAFCHTTSFSKLKGVYNSFWLTIFFLLRLSPQLS